jgi:hypothetical protein
VNHQEKEKVKKGDFNRSGSGDKKRGKGERGKKGNDLE